MKPVAASFTREHGSILRARLDMIANGGEQTSAQANPTWSIEPVLFSCLVSCPDMWMSSHDAAVSSLPADSDEIRVSTGLDHLRTSILPYPYSCIRDNGRVGKGFCASSASEAVQKPMPPQRTSPTIRGSLDLPQSGYREDSIVVRTGSKLEFECCSLRRNEPSSGWMSEDRNSEMTRTGPDPGLSRAIESFSMTLLFEGYDVLGMLHVPLSGVNSNLVRAQMIDFEVMSCLTAAQLVRDNSPVCLRIFTSDALIDAISQCDLAVIVMDW
ncbi:uncharacterized protein FOMMEDRAFT_166314 [Fomitiporia mediterranea MF3/22]|uniref:uncharacterized protein n=1 Tax=Fomitiporia mediterranea (strain MF3/22) TaxID=694068 RepID=UPI000440942A|nr:uncharacterized protein FOMMEDRAFT_166314 [Fomitiporia mediterranea MF3/22]EJD06018.1 hypothetical protein FOMMEDRAFT_166314 [Fomitiporia mediterranea MF3/22]